MASVDKLHRLIFFVKGNTVFWCLFTSLGVWLFSSRRRWYPFWYQIKFGYWRRRLWSRFLIFIRPCFIQGCLIFIFASWFLRLICLWSFQIGGDCDFRRLLLRSLTWTNRTHIYHRLQNELIINIFIFILKFMFFLLISSIFYLYYILRRVIIIAWMWIGIRSNQIRLLTLLPDSRQSLTIFLSNATWIWAWNNWAMQYLL